tara:strand:+ start:3624 stop:3824 length:201 start_codon:yes stop_codon:yes gene_type:complete
VNETITCRGSGWDGISIGDIITISSDSSSYRIVAMNQSELKIVPFPTVPMQKLWNMVYRITGEMLV